MKKLVLALLFIGFVYSACEKDDSTSQQTQTLEEKLIGEWQWIRFEDFHYPQSSATDIDMELPDGATVTFSDSPTDNADFFRNDGGDVQTSTWKKVNDHTFTLSNYPDLTQRLVAPMLTPKLPTSFGGSNILTFQSKVYEGSGNFHIIRYTLIKPNTP